MSILLVGVLITVCGSSWLMSWIGLELNMLGFIKINTTSSVDVLVIYFMIQAISSALFIVGGFHSKTSMELALLIKLGLAPFHFWLPMAASGLTILGLTMMLTIQKVAPLMLLYLSNLWLIFLSMSLLIGSLLMINQAQMSQLLAYSSIMNSVWMLMPFGMLYWAIYSLGLMMILLGLTSGQAYLCLLINFLSLGGLPPFIGFSPKLVILNEIIYNSMYFVLILLLASVIAVYSYLQWLTNYPKSTSHMTIMYMWPLLGLMFL